MNKEVLNTVVILGLIMIIIIRWYFSINDNRESLIERYSGNVVVVEGGISDEPLLLTMNR